MVADEVRAGRMTEEQAENHPSRNIISRALGAEPTVDVDLKTIMVEPGTAFLICSDGITRHVGDPEIKGVLNFGGEPEDVCSYLKDLCYERGAEDNLTAVVVKVRDAALQEEHISAAPIATTPAYKEEEDEVTVATARSPFEEVLHESDSQDLLELDTGDLLAERQREDDAPLDLGYSAASTVGKSEAVAGPFDQKVDDVEDIDEARSPEHETADPAVSTTVASTPFSAFDEPIQEERPEQDTFIKVAYGAALLIAGVLIGLGAFYLFFAPSSQSRQTSQLSEMTTANIPLSAFEENRRNVDKDPLGYITKFAGTPQDCEDYYLLGRAYLLAGDYVGARAALIESRSRLSEADPVNAKTLAADIAMAIAVTNDTTIQTNLRKELSASEPPQANANQATPR
jgi:hypothetical protein